MVQTGDREDCSLRLVWENGLQDTKPKITRAKWTEGVSQAVKCLLGKIEALSSNSSPTPTPAPQKI
jgi:hypothetical protein